jgi:hypothetical protein
VTRVAPLLVAALLVLAGCSAPVAETGESTTGTTTARTVTAATTDAPTTAAEQSTTAANAPDIAVRNGSLPVDPGVVFRRVQAILGTNVSAPRYVRVVDDPGDLVAGLPSGDRVPPFWRVTGLEAEQALNRTERERLENGVTTGMGGIRLYPGDGEAERVEWLLAHEFVHYVQVREQWGGTLRSTLPRTTDASTFVFRGVVEGVAVAATDEYIAAHLPGTAPNAALYREIHADLPPGSPDRYVNLAYIAGHRYVAERFETAAAATSVYADPPATSERLLHRAAGAPVALAVSVDAAEEWRHVGADRMGEAFLRVALENGLDPARAARGAGGWANDSLEVFRPRGGGDPGYAWVLRFDDAPNATVAADALQDSLTARGERAGERWRVANASVALRRPSDRTVVVVAGPGSFLDAATVDGEAGTVRVAVG